jgi:hypothetical protein
MLPVYGTTTDMATATNADISSIKPSTSILFAALFTATY